MSGIMWNEFKRIVEDELREHNLTDVEINYIDIIDDDTKDIIAIIDSEGLGVF